MARILVAAGVIPGPPVESAFFYRRHVVGHEVIAERIALVDGAPQVAGLRIDPETAARVADARCVHLHELAVRRVLENRGAVEFGRLLIRVVDVRGGADADEHLLTVFRKDHVARPVSTALRKIFDDDLGSAASFQVAALIREPHNRVRVADVQPLRVGARRIERDTIRLLQAGGEHRHLFGLSLGVAAAQHLDLPGAALDHERVAVRRETKLTRPLQIARVQIDFEARHGLRPRIRRPRHEHAEVARRVGGERLRQVGREQSCGTSRV